MRITIINIANKMPQWVKVACDEYLKRINHGKYSCKIIEIKSDKNANKPSLDNMVAEAKKFKEQIKPNSFVIALDEEGKKFSSTVFAKKLDQIALTTPDITFIIGGADGIHPEFKSSLPLTISLSALTFPHALVRVLILEQIYRAITILDNHPYHRE